MKNNKNGFTLVELVVVIAVSGIFFSMIAVILSNSLNIFGNIEDEYGNSSDLIIAESYTNKFISVVNKEGLALSVDSNQKIAKAVNNNKTYVLKIENNRIYYEVLENNEIKDSLSHELKNINIDLFIDHNLLSFSFKINEKEIRQNIFHVIGGCVNA